MRRPLPGLMRSVLLLLLAVVSPALAAPAADPELATVLEGFDRVQDSIRTLSAEFTETTTSALLIDPIVAEGRFFMTKPDAIRWEYNRPEEMRFVIDQDRYTGYFPEQKRAETRNIQRWSEHIFRFFGIGQGSTELSKFYTIRLADDANDVAGTHLLVLEPKKRRVRKRVEEVHFWLDRETYLPVRVEYLGQDGNDRTIRFRDIRLNPDLAADLYRVEIPSGVTVTTGFSGMPSFNPGSTQ